jgi:alcohol dehydrogenase
MKPLVFHKLKDVSVSTLVAEGKVTLDDVITHRIPLSEAARMYQIFNDKEGNCVKVVLKP